MSRAAAVPGVRGVGLVGLGAIGRVHAAALAAPAVTARFALVAAADLDARRTEGAPFRVVRDLEALVAVPEVEVVSIATPPDSHYALAATALQAGRHVLLEKPPALDHQQARALEELALRQGQCVVAAMHARHGPAVRRARDLLEGEELESFAVTYREDVHAYHPVGSWVFDRERAGGGVVMDSGINAVSVLTACGARDLRVQRAALTGLHGGVETRARVELTSSGGGTGHLDLDWRASGPETRAFTLTTVSGRVLALDLVRQSLEVDGAPVVVGDSARAHVDQVEEYVGVYAAYAESLADGHSDAGVVEMRVVDDVYRVAGPLPSETDA